MMRRASLLIVIGSFLLSACSTAQAPSNIAIEDAWLRPVTVESASDDAMAHETAMPMDGMEHTAGMQFTDGNSAAYVTLVNTGGADVLQNVATDSAAIAEVHQTTMTDSIMRMQQVERVDIPANGRIEFSPGGYHIMLNGFTRSLAPGDTITLTFTFEHAGEKQVTATVREP